MTRVQSVLRNASSQFTDARGGGVAALGSEAGKSNAGPALLTVVRTLMARALTAWRWIERKRTQQLASRRMRVVETVSLGEKRLVSIVQVDGRQFLIGGATGSVSLLAVLDGQSEAPAWQQAREERLP